MTPDSDKARAAIFADLERQDRASGRQPERSPQAITAEAAALLADIAEARPPLSEPDSLKAFLARAAGPKVNATTATLASLNELPAEVARLLSDLGHPPSLTLQPHEDLISRDWTSAGLTLTDMVDDGAYLTLAPYAIAETGSVVLHSGPETPILPNFLAAIEIIAVKALNIVAHLEDYSVRIRAAGLSPPRNLCLITGPSGTSDIEGAFVRGAHGPGHVHIVVIAS